MIKNFFIIIIFIYKYFFSPFFICCRFYPTCSVYAVEVLTKYGIFMSLYLIIKRLCKCQPLCKGGYDPVP